MLQRALIVALLLVTGSSCAPLHRRSLNQFRPMESGTCRLDIRSYPSSLPARGELLARYVLTNVSDHWVRGCVSIQRRWTFYGTGKPGTVERSGTHQICRREDEFFLSDGETFSWLDAVTVPDVGEGEVEVAVEVDIVLVDWHGKVPWRPLSTVHGSFAIQVEAGSNRGVTSNSRIKLPVRPVTAVACATAAPVRPAAYAVRWAYLSDLDR